MQKLLSHTGLFIKSRAIPSFPLFYYFYYRILQKQYSLFKSNCQLVPFVTYVVFLSYGAEYMDLAQLFIPYYFRSKADIKNKVFQ